MPDAMDNDTPAQWSAQFPSAKEGDFPVIVALAEKLLSTGELPMWQFYLLRQLIAGTQFHLRYSPPETNVAGK